MLRNGIPAGPCGGGYGVCCVCKLREKQKEEEIVDNAWKGREERSIELIEWMESKE